MDRVLIRKLTSVCVVASLFLAACGGGGGDGGTTPPPSGNITVSGTITFDRPTYTSNNTLNFFNQERLPVRGATIELLRASDQSVLVTTTTDGTSGAYSASIANVPFIVRVKAQLRRAGTGGYDVEVRNNTSGNALYTLDSSTITPSNSTPRVDLNAPTGWVNGSYVNTRAAAPFAILHMLWEAKLLLQAAEPGLTMPALDVYWSVLNNLSECTGGLPNPTTGAIGTTFFVGATIAATASCPATPPGIYVLGDANGGFDDDPDEFDSSVIAHELGHYFQDAFSRDESMGGPHFPDSLHDLRLAFSEGWGNAFQGFVLDDPLYRDTVGATGSTGFYFDMENDTAPFSVASGFFAEASIHEVLWDVYDGVGEVVGSQTTDQISLGYGAIHSVMREHMVATDAMTSIFAFATGLEFRNPGQQAAIRSRLNDENINGTGDFGQGQAIDVNDDGVNDNNDLVPVFVPVATLGAPVQVISTNRFADLVDTLYQSYNRLGARRYLTFDLPGGALRITAQGPAVNPTTGQGSDPDFFLYRDGVDQCTNYGSGCSGLDDSLGSGLEEASYFGLPAGTYVLEVFECSYLGEICRTPVFGSSTAIAVTVTPQ
jgi:hypothetical protein